MDFGDVLLRTSLLAVLAAGALYLLEFRGRRVAAAGWLFSVHAALIVAALVILFAHFLGHHFEYAYVADHSSRALTPAMAFAATWAGQEGSILLWIAIAAAIGVALMVQPGTLARPAMAFVCAAQVALMSLLMVRSPFVHSIVIPLDGKGLNPLLEDPWMVIHPPVLFVGYAALLVPAALAAAAVARGGEREWNRMVWPWALFGVLSLGTGIALGGIWAYKVLGWGGYWGWDPVENASLVPWLVAVALLHGLMIQRTTGTLMRTNLALAFLGWSTVVGGTYLTRSGVLQDFSVHSFADAGLNTPLVTGLMVFTILPAALLAWRWQSLRSTPVASIAMSRESALWLGMMTVLALGGLVLIGTTAPLLTALVGKPASVRASFYESVSVPLGIALVLLMGLSPALRWFRQQGLSWLSGVVPGLAGAALVTVPAVMAGVRAPGLIVVIAMAGLALGVNAVVAGRLFRRGWAFGAGYLGHAGVAVMVLGMALSSGLGKSERLQLAPGRPVDALGYRLTLTGIEEGARGDRTLAVEIRDADWTFAARPALLPAPQMDGVIRKPAIHGAREIYLAPMDVERPEPGEADALWLERGRPVDVGGARVTFAGFRMTAEQGFLVYADMRVEHGAEVATVSPGLAAGPDGSAPLDARAPGLGAVRVAHIDADGGRVAVLFPDALAQPTLAIVEFSTKPFINLVWIGVVLTFAGLAMAGIRRAAERRPARTAPRRAVAARRA